MRVGYLGPSGTFSEEALLAAPTGEEMEPVPLATVHDTVMAVQERRVERALVPIENALEGLVGVTLDVLAGEADRAVIVGELVHAVSLCLVAREPVELTSIERVASHPQPLAQCARFLRERLPGATVVPASSTAEAVRRVARDEGPGWAALGTSRAAELYGAAVLEAGVEDEAGNATRFVWLADADGGGEPAGGGGAWKTSVVFWGSGDDQPGWLVRCLSEFAFRGVNLTMIASRPRRMALGHYMFFADLDGAATEERVAEAIAAVREKAPTVRVLGSYPAA